jgi:hypothetical protein
MYGCKMVNSIIGLYQLDNYSTPYPSCFPYSYCEYQNCLEALPDILCLCVCLAGGGGGLQNPWSKKKKSLV